MTSSTRPLPHPLADDEALRRRMVALARHWLAHGDEAEDLVQETWLRTKDGALPLAAGGREAWLITVLRHLCIDAWRRRARYQAILERLGEDGASAPEDDQPERLADLAQRVEQALLHLVRTVPPGDVAAVMLHEVFGFSHAELGALAGRSEAASRQQLHRMLQRLRQAGSTEAAVDDDPSDLLALCKQALAWREPAGLIAVLRASRPQAMALSAQAIRPDAGNAGEPAMARLLQIGNLLALRIQVGDGPAIWVPLGEAIAEPA